MSALTKYSQTISLVGATPNTLEGLVSTNMSDARQPYSFAEWVGRNVGIIPGKEKEQYNEYVLRWYAERDLTNTLVQSSVKQDYIALLKQLAIAFRDEAEKVWATDVNFDDDLELEQVIPFYARKLKEVAIYLINKREAIKKAKLKYNTVGSRDAIERLFYEYLLKAFTKKRFPGNEYTTNVSNVSVFQALPELSASSPTFQIFVEELYDDAMYFDRNPDLSASSYFDLTSFPVTSYFDSKFNITDYATVEWLYNTGVTQLCADNPLFWAVDDVISQYKNGVPLSALESSDNYLLNDYNRIALTKKYLGETQYFVSGGCYELWTKTFNFNFQQGNNWFYWVTGEYPFENDRSFVIDPMPISSTNLAEIGTAGLTYYDSDVIFTNRDNILSGAWLREINQISATPTMSAKLLPGTYEFVFPYPGYGVSGEYLDWTGRQFQNLDFAFYYLTKDIQTQVQNLYWSTNVGDASAFTPIRIQDSTLIESGAKPGSNFNEADQLTIRLSGLRDSISDGVFTGSQQYAWLYKMDKTDLPIKDGTNYLYWPFARTGNTSPIVALSSQCAPVSLSSINISQAFIGSTAGSVLSGGDVIYKLRSPQGDKIEAAWLSGTLLPFSGIIEGASQPGLTFDSQAGVYTPFIWENSITAADQVFTHYPHQRDCQYLNQSIISLFNFRPSQGSNIDYNQWQKCTCKSIFYSPLGHPGAKYNDYEGMCDYIALMPSPTASFSFGSWLGTDGKNYLNSNDFGWFKLSGTGVEPDVGWGSGNWVTNTGNTFYLSANELYVFFRSALNRDDTTQAPYFVKKYNYNNNNQKWVRATKNDKGNWVSDDVVSNMIIHPGDYLQYEHKNTNSFTISTLGPVSDTVVYNASAVNKIWGSSFSSYWSNYTYVTTGTEVIVKWPDIIFEGGPLIRSSQLSSIDWHVSTPYGTYTLLKENPTISFSFATNQTGVYSITATGYSDIGIETAGPNTFSYNVFISPVTCVETEPTFTNSIIIDTFTQDTLNFSINVPLSGWNYTTNSYDGVSLGGRPYWAKATDLGTAETKYKGTSIWGGIVVPVDSYNFISQPEYSDIILTQDIYIQYKRNDTTPIIWRQPLTVTHDIQQRNWCKLIIDTNAISNLSAVVGNNITDLIVSGTNQPSDIVLDIIENQPLLINYFALNPITWVQEVSNSSLGLPPTGGVWLPPISGVYTTPITPYAYLTNRHFPTYASAPSISELYSTVDTGGYYIPKNFGVSTYLTKRMTTKFNTLELDGEKKSRIFQDPLVYEKDRGLTNSEMQTPISATSVDSNWMKASITEGQKSGMIVGARDHQEFMPYQARYETIKNNTIGLRQQNDKYDPWTGVLDNTWENSTDWPPDFRKQYSIEAWYEQFNTPVRQVYQWQSDIFGNQYFLLKERGFTSLYQERQSVGQLWVRDQRNIVQPLSTALPTMFESFSIFSTAAAHELNLVGFKRFDMFFDVISLETPNFIMFAKLNFDYAGNNGSGEIYTVADNSYIFDLKTTEGGKYGGHWFFPEEKRLTFCIMRSSVSGFVYPDLKSIDLDSFVVETILLNNNTNSLITQTSSLNITSYEQPVFTYNNITQTYNISFICKGTTYADIIVETIYLTQFGNFVEYTSVKALTPNSYVIKNNDEEEIAIS